MISKKVVVNAENGLHMRPAALFVQEALSFQCSVNLEVNGKRVNGKSLFKLQTLELGNGCELTIICDGEEQECHRALECLVKFISELK